MHLGNGAITPQCAALGFAAAATGLGCSCFLTRRSQGATSFAKAAALGSLVLALQMINLPVLATSSVHFVGGVLLAELLGPAIGAVTMSLVLLLQAVLLGDGGLAALGLNIVNMALVPAGFLALARRLAGVKGGPALLPAATSSQSLAIVSVLSIAAAVLLIAGEAAWGRSAAQLVQWPRFMAAMVAAHLPLLALEASFTVGLVGLVRRLESAGGRQAIRWQVVVAAGAVLLIASAAGISSGLPDGYEAALQTSGLDADVRATR